MAEREVIQVREVARLGRRFRRDGFSGPTGADRWQRTSEKTDEVGPPFTPFGVLTACPIQQFATEGGAS